MIRQRETCLMERWPHAIRIPIIKPLQALSRWMFYHAWMYDPVDLLVDRNENWEVRKRG